MNWTPISRRMKSLIAAAVSAALVVTSGAAPASRAYAQAVSAAPAAGVGAGAGMAAVSLPAASAIAPLGALGALPQAAPSLAAPASAPALSAASSALSAAAAPSSPAASAAPAEAAAAPAQNAPSAEESASASPAASDGPRWVGSPSRGEAPAATAVGWISRQFSRWTGASAALAGSRRLFDGEDARARTLETVAASSSRATAASGLASASDPVERVIEDHSIPTPEAARRVAEIRRERGTPLWVKVAAPLSVAAAALVAVQYGAVPVLTLAAGLVVSVLAHEVAHLAVLKALGDHTAEHAHGASLNPFHHVDPVKTVILPALSLAVSSALLPFPVLLGSGKAVDADFNNLRGPLGGPRSARNAFWVAAAGPLTNFALAALAFGAASLLPAGGVLAGVAFGLARMNAALGLFNLLPLPQLDGGKMLASLLPEAWYARWVYNPKVEKGYQGLFRRLYEGPSNLLALIAEKLGVRSQSALNRVANGVTFGALAAFYAVAYIHFSVALPLLFLALPCTYDYWCIREKVRSEAAVQDAMDIFSQWSSVIAQISEDRGMASEVSLFEAEHAMKNALETLIDEKMADERFRALSDDEKIAELMKAYPERAADFLKDKVFTEDADTREKILELLADQRNTPFYERTRRWLAEHDIFNRWDNPKYEGKLRDEMKEAGKPQQKANGQRGSTTLSALLVMGTLGGAAAMFPELAHHLPGLAAGGVGLLGMLGTLAPGSSRSSWQAKLRQSPNHAPGQIVVLFRAGTSVEYARRALSGYANKSAVGQGARLVFRVDAGSAEAAAASARELASDARVERVSVGRPVYRSLAVESGAPDGVANAAQPAQEPAAEPEPAAAPVETPEAAAARREALIEAEASARDAQQDWREKVRAPGADDPLMNNELRVRLAPGVSPEAREKLGENFLAMSAITRTADSGGDMVLTTRFGVDDAAAAVEEIAALKAVQTVTAPVDVRDRLLSTALPEKIASHGKADWSASAVLVSFHNAKTDAEVAALVAKLKGAHPFRQGAAWGFSAASEAAAAETARELAADADVASVEVHPNVAAALENRVKRPYPDAQSYDPSQAVLVAVKPGTGADALKEYAEARRLRLVYPKFRGAENLALFEIPSTADAAATRQILADETLDEGSIAAEVRAFREQPGEAALAPSAEARARAERRRAEAAAAEEAARRKPRRDVEAEWIAFVQNAKMQDGTPIPPKMAELLLGLLKPVAKGPGESRPPVVARSEEVKRILPIVTSPRGMRNSVILVGGAGTGKTAVAEGLAEMIEDADHASANDSEQFLQFQRLKGRWLVELDINKILSSDDPVKVLNAVLDLLPRFNDPNPGRGNEIIVLMDEIQKFFLDNNGQKIANVLKGPLRDGKISVIATTTDAEYKKFIESDDAFRRRLEKIAIEEPTVPQTIRILRAMKSWLQKIHDAAISDEALVSAAKLADQFDKTNYNPDKAIKAVQDAAELSRPDNLRAAITLDIRETWNELVTAANEARQALLDKGVPSALALPVEAYNKIVALIDKAAALYAEREAVADGEGRVSVDAVKRVIAQKTGIGSGQLNLAEEDAARYVKMEEEVGGRVVNQERAIRAIADAIRRNKAGLSNPNRPMGKFLLVGPTGVGKTYLAKELARFLFNDPDAMTRFDMSEFMEEHSAMRLTGAPPSYVGYGEGGQLTEAVRKKPYSVLLFDEVEKAHPKVFDLLLQVLDDGRLTDGEGRTVDFKNTVILLTSNAGMAAVDGPEFVRRMKAARQAQLDAGAGEAAADAAAAKIEKEWDADIDAQVAEAIHGRFRPEFLNRLDDGPSDDDGVPAAQKDDSKKVKWIRVNRLRQQDMRKIAQLQVRDFQRLLADRHDTDLEIDPSVIEFLSVEGYSPLYGARPMTGAIEKNIIDPLAQWILREAASGNNTVRGGLIKATMKDGKVVFTAEAKPAKDIERATVRGAAEAAAAEILGLIERLSAGESADEPSEGLFDKILRSVRPAPAKQAGAAAPTTASLFAPEVPAPAMPGASAVAATNNRAKAADPVLRAQIKAIADGAQAAGWPPEVLAALAPPAGSTGEGWLKQFIAFSKERAQNAGVSAPIELTSSVDADAIRASIHMDAELTDADKAFLAAHFTGTPPASYEAAQQTVDNLNVNGSFTRNHQLLDLYRRLSAIPGVRLGYASGARARGAKGSDLWIELRKPQAASAPAAAPSAAKAPAAATPHELSEAGKTRELLMRFVDQSRLAERDQDGTSIKVAAAEGWARLATKAQLEEARAWFPAHNWESPNIPQMSITSHNALAMTAALVFQRFGDASDIARLENLSANLNDYSHYQVPLHNALVDALAALYTRAGLAEIRRAQVRAAQISGKNKRDVENALARALGEVGYPADHDAIKASPEGIFALARRTGRVDDLLAEFRDPARWSKISAERRAAALMAVAAQPQADDETFQILGEMISGRGSRSAERTIRYQAAQTWATLVARGHRTKGLSQAMVAYVDKHGIQGYNDPWGILYAYVLAAEQAGGPDLLPALEKIMNIDPNAVGSNHEQMYFSTPEAWAKALIRNGRFSEYARKTLGPDGAPQPSRLEKMLMSKDRPLLVSAALRAIALSRDASYRPAASGEPELDHPQQDHGEAHGGGGYGYGGYPYGQRHDYLMRRFGEIGLPPM